MDVFADPYGDQGTPATQEARDEQYDREEPAQDYRPGRSSRRIIGVGQPQGSAAPAPSRGQTQVQPVQPVQPVQQTPAVPVPAPAQPQNAQAASAAALPQTEGVVRNIVEGKDPKGFMKRWFRSFSLGTSFPRTNEEMEFQVFSNWANTGSAQGYAADKVILFGRIVSGKPLNDNTVRVYGRRDKNNVIHAEEVENTTDGTRVEIDPAPLPAAAVRIITLAVLALILFLVIAVSRGIGSLSRGVSEADLSGAAQGITGGLKNLLFAALSAVGVYYFGGKTLGLIRRKGDFVTLIIFAVLTLVFLSLVGTFLRALVGA